MKSLTTYLVTFLMKDGQMNELRILAENPQQAQRKCKKYWNELDNGTFAEVFSVKALDWDLLY